MKQDKKNKRGLKNYFFLGFFIFLFDLLFGFFKKNEKKIKLGAKEFIREETEEVSRFLSGRENFCRFVQNSKILLIDYFIPNTYNNHHPKILHTKSLIVMLLLVVAAKVGLVSYLFLSYPNNARMATDMADTIVELINIDRENGELSPLLVNKELTRAALEKAQNMLDLGYFAHIGPDGKKPWDYIVKDDYDYVFVGENLAMNFTSAQSAHRALMNSASHKKNIMGDRYTEVGIAIVRGILEGEETNVLVQIFATERQIPIAVGDNKIAGTTKVIDYETIDNKLFPAIVGEVGNDDLTNETSTVVSDFDNMEEIKNIADFESNTTKMTRKIISEEEMENTSPLVQASIIPNKDIEYERIVKVKSFDSEYSEATNRIKFYYALVLSVLFLVTFALLLKIFINLHIQHKFVILQSLMLIIFIFSLIYFKFHALEDGVVDILVL